MRALDEVSSGLLQTAVTAKSHTQKSGYCPSFSGSLSHFQLWSVVLE